MAEYQLSGEVRATRGRKNRQLRRDGYVPAIIYGPANDPISVKFPYREIEVTLMNAGGTNLIDLTIEGKNIPIIGT